MLEVNGLPGDVFETPKGFTRKQMETGHNQDQPSIFHKAERERMPLCLEFSPTE
jgi:hypothetical protein